MRHSPISGGVQNAADQFGSVDVDLFAFTVAQVVEYEVLWSHKLFAIALHLCILIEYFSQFVGICSFDMLSILVKVRQIREQLTTVLRTEEHFTKSKS